MSVCFSTYCTKCSVEAPEIGDQGMMGHPSSEVRQHHHCSDWGEGYSYSFGWIYEGFSSVGIITHEMAAYRAFLTEHEKHNVVQTCDHDDDPDIQKELEKMNWDSLERFELGREGFVSAYYEAFCPETGEKFRSAEPELLKSFEDRTLTKEQMLTFRKHLIEAPDVYDYINRTFGLTCPWDDLDNLADFFRSVTASDKVPSVSVRFIPAT